MTPNDVSTRLLRLLEMAGEDATSIAQEIEALRLGVLEAIAGGASNPAALARIALLTTELGAALA
jgi:hypothetical protein